MKPLILRELRRQVAPLVALVGLAALLLLTVDGVRSFGVRIIDVSAGLFALLSACGAWLLGTNAFAPDAESGGEAFLAALPVAPRRLFAVRFAVAAASAAALVALLWALVLHWPGANPSGAGARANEATVVAAIGLAVGVLGAVVCRQTLLALVAAPVCLAPLGAYLGWCDLLGTPGNFKGFALLAATPLFSMIAVVTYARTRTERGLARPLRLSGAILVGILLTASLLTGVAGALERARGVALRLCPGPVAYGGTRTVLPVAESYAGTWRGGLLRPLPRFHTVVLAHDAPSRPRLIEDSTFQPGSLSPDGRRLLVLRGSRLGHAVAGVVAGLDGPAGAAWELLDLETGAAERAPAAGWQRADMWSAAQTGGGVDAVVWSAGVPWLVTPSSLDRYDGGASWSYPAGTHPVAAAQRRLVLERDDGQGWAVWSDGQAAPDPVELPPGASGSDLRAALGPEGRWWVVLDAATSDRLRVWSRDLTGADGWTRAELPFAATLPRWAQVTVVADRALVVPDAFYDPTGGRLPDQVAVVDLRTGAAGTVASRAGPALGPSGLELFTDDAAWDVSDVTRPRKLDGTTDRPSVPQPGEVRLPDGRTLEVWSPWPR